MLLSNKFTTPRLSPLLVARPALFDRLDQFIHFPLTLLTAPAGYGKTTLVASWQAQRESRIPPVAWLLLDEYDDDPARFMRYLIGAIQQQLPQVGKALLERLQTNHVAPLAQSGEEMLTTLIHELTALATPLLLVIDDLHQINNPQIHHALRFWIEQAPALIHTVVISRDASMLPVARWRVQQRCHEVTMQELRFSPNEAITYVRNLLRLELNDAEILQLVTRTEGWIAGLQLAALSLQNAENPKRQLQNFAGSDRHITDYLVEEVLEKQPPALRNFLLATSILKRFSPALCDFVLQRSDSHQLLELLEKRHLFLTPLDNQRDWYRYHPLFAEVLQRRLQSSQSASVNELHQRAHEWWQQAGESDLAIEHGLLAQCYPQTAALLQEQSYAMLWQQGRPRIFLHWCEQLPETLRFAFPALLIGMGWAYLLVGKYQELSTLTKALVERWQKGDFQNFDERQMRGEIALLEAEVAIHRGEIAVVMQLLAEVGSETALMHPTTQAIAQQLYGFAHRLEGNIAAARSFLNRAIALAEATNDNALWLFAHFDLAETNAMAGEVTLALAICTKIVRRFVSQYSPNHYSLAFIHMRMAHLLFLQNRLSEAIDAVQQGIQISANTRWITRYGLLVLAQIRALQGKWGEADDLLTEIQRLQGRRESRSTQLYFAATIARLYHLRNEPQQSLEWIAACQRHATAVPRYQQHQVAVTLARHQVASDAPSALRALDALRQDGLQNGWHETLLEIEILRALTLQSIGQSVAALLALEEALALAEADQLLVPFLREGAAMAQLLRQALNQTNRRIFVGQLLAAFLPVTATLPAPPQPALAEALTKREVEVLRLLALGHSNPEIAETLILATGTVAKHTNNIFGKLGVRNRTEAVQQAQALGLI